MGVYQDIAFCCVDNLPISRWQRWRYKMAMMYAYLRRWIFFVFFINDIYLWYVLFNNSFV